MKYLLITMILVSIVLVVSAEAQCKDGRCVRAPKNLQTSKTGPIRSSLAQNKADRMARNGRMGHLGGGFGGGRAEGVGVGSTRQSAIRNCCFWGRRTPIDIGVATNGRRWYACVIYK